MFEIDVFTSYVRLYHKFFCSFKYKDKYQQINGYFSDKVFETEIIERAKYLWKQYRCSAACRMLFPKHKRWHDIWRCVDMAIT